jgi:hypothetical protein
MSVRGYAAISKREVREIFDPQFILSRVLPCGIGRLWWRFGRA